VNRHPSAHIARDVNRREFLRTTGLGASTLWLGAPQILRAQSGPSANDKLNIGIIGVAGQGGYSIGQLKSIANIAALCDVDETNLNAAAQKFPGAKTYRDFRRLVEQKDLEAAGN